MVTQTDKPLLLAAFQAARARLKNTKTIAPFAFLHCLFLAHWPMRPTRQAFVRKKTSTWLLRTQLFPDFTTIAHFPSQGRWKPFAKSEQNYKRRTSHVVELVNERLSGRDGRPSVHAQVAVFLLLHEPLQDIQHLLWENRSLLIKCPGTTQPLPSHSPLRGGGL